MDEPPAIEGYLDRVRANTQTKQPVYLTTHDGNIFCLSSGHANPPSPLGLGPAVSVDDLKRSEVQRGGMQLMHATGVIDLRAILAVRRAFQAAVPHSHTETRRLDDQSSMSAADAALERTESDYEDEGGDEALGKSEDKPHLRMKRSFELLLTNGHVIRFEVGYLS